MEGMIRGRDGMGSLKAIECVMQIAVCLKELGKVFFKVSFNGGERVLEGAHAIF